MDIRINARFWSNHMHIEEFCQGNVVSFHHKNIRKTPNGEKLFSAGTEESRVSSLTETIAVITCLYDNILADSGLTKMILDKKGCGEIYVASFGQPCELEGEVSHELMEKIEESRVSLFLKNYPLKEDINPGGHYFVHFE